MLTLSVIDVLATLLTSARPSRASSFPTICCQYRSRLLSLKFYPEIPTGFSSWFAVICHKGVQLTACAGGVEKFVFSSTKVKRCRFLCLWRTSETATVATLCVLPPHWRFCSVIVAGQPCNAVNCIIIACKLHSGRAVCVLCHFTKTQRRLKLNWAQLRLFWSVWCVLITFLATDASRQLCTTPRIKVVYLDKKRRSIKWGEKKNH